MSESKQSSPVHILLGIIVLCIIVQMLGLYDFTTLMDDKPINKVESSTPLTPSTSSTSSTPSTSSTSSTSSTPSTPSTSSTSSTSSTPSTSSTSNNIISKYTRNDNKFISTKWYPPIGINSEWDSLRNQSMGKKFISIENSAAECELYPECVSFVFSNDVGTDNNYWLGNDRIFENVPDYTTYSK